MLVTVPENEPPAVSVKEFVTSVAASAGRAAGGELLLPGPAEKVVPQLGVKPFAKPLNAAGAGPELRLFGALHWLLQNVTWEFRDELPSPTTKAPEAGKAAIRGG